MTTDAGRPTERGCARPRARSRAPMRVRREWSRARTSRSGCSRAPVSTRGLRARSRGAKRQLAPSRGARRQLALSRGARRQLALSRGANRGRPSHAASRGRGRPRAAELVAAAVHTAVVAARMAAVAAVADVAVVAAVAVTVRKPLEKKARDPVIVGSRVFLGACQQLLSSAGVDSSRGRRRFR